MKTEEIFPAQYTDSRGWLWERRSAGDSWQLRRINDVECYGYNLHIWVKHNWFGDKMWHVGRGGSPCLETLYKTAKKAMEGAFDIARQTAQYRVDRADAEKEMADKVLAVVLGTSDTTP